MAYGKVKLPFARKKIFVTLPTMAEVLTYNGKAQTPTWNNYDSSQLIIGGVYHDQTNAGTYYATFTPASGCCWSDGTTTTKSVAWTINKAAGNISIDPTSGSINYGATTTFTVTKTGDGALSVDSSNKNAVTASLSDNTVTLTGVGSSSGNITITVSMPETANYTAASATYTATVSKLQVAVPTVTSNLTYNGQAQSPTISAYDTNLISVSGNSAVDAGTHTVVFSLKDKNNYTWADGTTADKTVDWNIAVMKLPTPTATTTSFNYSASGNSLEVKNYNPEYMIQSGDVSAVNPGNYTATYTLNSANVAWVDGTTAPVNIDWSIGAMKLFKPSATTTSFTYNGEEQTLDVKNYNPAYMTQSGEVSATNAGTRYVTYSLKNKDATTWSDGTTNDVTIEWTIGKMTPTLTLSPSVIALSSAVRSRTVTYYYKGDGEITVIPGNNKISTSVEGNVITVNYISGVAGDRIPFTVNASETDNCKPISAQGTVNIASASITASATEIRDIIRAGLAPSTWNVGDYFPITLNGDTGCGLSFNNKQAYAIILGFDHNIALEGFGAHSVHFALSPSSTLTAFQSSFAYTSNYANYNSNGFQYIKKHAAGAETAATNNPTTTAGGWNSSHLRKTVMAGFLSVLPTEWKNVITTCTKYTDNYGYHWSSSHGGIGYPNTADGKKYVGLEEHVTATSDKMFTLSPVECWGGTGGANTHESAKQSRYSYFAQGGSPPKNINWWTRSIASGSTFYYMDAVYGNTSGTSSNDKIVYADKMGVVPCFMIS